MGNTLPKRALKPVVEVAKDATVMDAVEAMASKKVGATVILEAGGLLGVFTERDVVTRVVQKRLNPETTRVSEVMTSPVLTVRENADRKMALRLMLDNHIRHLPVVDADGKVVSMLSMRHLLRSTVEDLEQTVWSLVADTAIDGPGG